MRIRVINPNTTESMTETIAAAARAIAAPGTEIAATTARSGAVSLEGHYDEAMSVVGLVEAITEDPNADAYVIACFGDPGLLAAAAGDACRGRPRDPPDHGAGGRDGFHAHEGRHGHQDDEQTHTDAATAPAIIGN